MKHFITQIRMPTEAEPQRRTERSVLIVRYGFSSGKVGMMNPCWRAAAEPVWRLLFFCSPTRENARTRCWWRCRLLLWWLSLMLLHFWMRSSDGSVLKTLSGQGTQHLEPICDSLHERIQKAPQNVSCKPFKMRKTVQSSPFLYPKRKCTRWWGVS